MTINDIRTITPAKMIYKNSNERMNSDDDDDDDGAAAPSLSQLIYSQSSQQQQQPDGGRKIKIEGDSIDDFYGLETKKPELTAKKRAKKAAAAIRKKRMSQHHARRFNIDDCSYVETQSVTDERNRKIAIQRQLEITKFRWKSRKHDFRNEEDVGGVFDALVRKHYKKNPDNNEEEEEDPQKQSYWDQGLTGPSQLAEVPAPSQVRIKKRALPIEQQLHKFPLVKQPRLQEARHHFKQQHPVNCPFSGVHFHQATLAKIAAHHLICGNCDEELEDRLLMSLYKVDHNCRSDAVLTEALEYGLNYQLFLQHNWKDRIKAGEQLGIFKPRKLNRIRSTHRQHAYAEGVILRKRVLGLSSSKIDETEKTLKEKMEILLMDEGDQEENDQQSEERTFRYNKGEVPPTPQLPMEKLNFMFGTEDRYSQAMRIGRIESSASDLTLSTLLSRIAAADLDEVLPVHECIKSFLEMLVKENQLSVRGLQNLRRSGGIPVAAVLEYQSWMQYCRYTANSKVSSQEDADDNVKVEEDADELLEANASTVADQMALVLEDTLKRPGLTSFPRLHLIHALCLVARELPPDAANLFARGDYKTPFDGMRQTLEFLEKACMLKAQPGDVVQSRSILAAHLEHVLHQAAEIVESCCVSESTEIDYMAWLLALRLSSLLLSSGIKIGGAAFPYQSLKSKTVDLDSYFSQDAQSDCLPHEVRQSLPKYEETRLLAAEACRDFLRSTQKTGARKSQMIVTVLEWSQAVALMVGPGKNKSIASPNPGWKRVRVLHSWHALQAPPLTFAQVQALNGRDGINHDNILDTLALKLENDPSNKSHWRRFVQELGPLRGSEQKQCKKCSECKCLRKDFFVDHARKKKHSWWGRQRVSWWEAHLLTLPPRIPKSKPDAPAKAATVFSVGQAVEQKLQNEVLPIGAPIASETDTSTADITYEWLDRIIQAIKKKTNARDKKPAKPSPFESRSVSVDDFLPLSISKCAESAGDASNPCVPNLDDQRLEFICYKIFIRAHLCGADDVSVMNGVWFLARQYGTKAWKRMTPHNKEGAWQCLLWLATKGLRISRILMNYHDSIEPAERKNVFLISDEFSDEARENMILGVQCFGAKHLTEIRDNVPFFASWSRVELRRLHIFMRRKEYF